MFSLYKRDQLICSPHVPAPFDASKFHTSKEHDGEEQREFEVTRDVNGSANKNAVKAPTTILDWNDVNDYESDSVCRHLLGTRCRRVVQLNRI